VLSRHVNAFLVQRYFHEAVATNPKLFKLFESLGTVGSFFADDEAACTFDSMRDWLSAQRETLRAELLAWVPSFSHGLGAPDRDGGDDRSAGPAPHRAHRAGVPDREDLRPIVGAGGRA
jgi:hypothetical protein